MRTFSNEVRLLSLDDKNQKTARSLREAGVKVKGPVSVIEQGEGYFQAVLQDGQTPFLRHRLIPRSAEAEFAVALGARTNDVGCLEVDAHRRTTVDGIYAAGDVVSDLHQIAGATGHAATHIHKSLPENFKALGDATDHAAA